MGDTGARRWGVAPGESRTVVAMSRRRPRPYDPAPEDGPDSAAPPRVLPDPDRPGAWVVRIGTTDQSHIDPDRPTVLEFDYMQRIAEAIDAYAPPGERIRIVHIGGAGMSLARYVAATRPTSAQVVLEPDAALTQEVRDKAPLPRHSGIKVRPVDGRSGIAEIPADHADIVVLDAFDGARVPADLVTAEFLAEVRRVLVTGGLFLANVTDVGTMDWSRRVAAGVRSTWAHAAISAEPSTWRGRRFGNVILYGSAAALPTRQLAREAASAVFAYRFLDEDELADWCAGARPYTDADTEPSPMPPELFLGH
ncbi:fused MFS/spermidine synthase [Raineyella sp. LH-20]|uniref:spermidine synthase n=1 Tax=Raineyella sp. LH-20 TaxID=3081204 RepID=UPI002952D0E2|nr:fused MFS/spermidine synthase [Raineyella sp. LH-20]WOP20125.1 fused MFS/spermidine synthase [Raineyella sp. LH-20]